MKKTIPVAIALILVAAISGLSSCTKSVTANYTIADIPMCLSANTLPQQYQSVTFQINHNDIIAAVNSAGVKDVSRVLNMNLKQMNAVITTSGGNFDQISNVEVYLKTTNTPNDSVQIAYSNTLNTGDTQTVLLMTGSDIKAALSYDPIITFKILNKTAGNTTCVKLTQGIIEMKIRS